MDDSWYSTTSEGLVQVNPQTAVDESEQFISNFNAAQTAANAQIQDETHALGTQIPAQTGGINAGDYWTEMYQAAPVKSQISNLRTAMQLQGLTNVMQNIQNQAAEQVNQAQRKLNNLRAKYIPKFYDYELDPNQFLYKKQEKKSSGGGGGYYPTTPTYSNAGKVNTKSTSTKKTTAQAQGTLRSSGDNTTTVMRDDLVQSNGAPGYEIQDITTGKVLKTVGTQRTAKPKAGGGGGGGGW